MAHLPVKQRTLNLATEKSYHRGSCQRLEPPIVCSPNLIKYSVMRNNTYKGHTCNLYIFLDILSWLWTKSEQKRPTNFNNTLLELHSDLVPQADIVWTSDMKFGIIFSQGSLMRTLITSGPYLKSFPGT